MTFIDGDECKRYRRSYTTKLKGEIKEIGYSFTVVHGEHVSRLVKRWFQTKKRLVSRRNGHTGYVDSSLAGSSLILVQRFQQQTLVLVVNELRHKLTLFAALVRPASDHGFG